MYMNYRDLYLLQVDGEKSTKGNGIIKEIEFPEKLSNT